MRNDYYALFSTLLDYPVKGSLEFANESSRCFADEFPEASAYINNFTKESENLSLAELEELYTRTFDIQGRACLDLGYVLFGEDYKRGEFLVVIQGLARDHKVETGVELPDHLTNILRLLNNMNEGSRKEMCEKILMPALTKILDNFSGNTTGEDLYVSHLLALKSFLENIYKMDRSILGGPVC